LFLLSRYLGAMDSSGIEFFAQTLDAGATRRRKGLLTRVATASVHKK